MPDLIPQAVPVTAAPQAASPPAPRTLDAITAKPFWHSRTLWFNTICAALGAAEASMGLVQASLPVNAYGALAFVLAVGNTALRVVTTQALAGPAHRQAGPAS